MLRALVTGFEPFAGESINSSYEAVRRLTARIGSLDITTAQLPTAYRRALAAEISNSAGTFVCNHVFYGLMHLAATGGNFRGGFLHVPSLQRQSTPAVAAAPMVLDDIVRAIRIALEVSAASPVSVPGRS